MHRDHGGKDWQIAFRVLSGIQSNRGGVLADRNDSHPISGIDNPCTRNTVQKDSMTQNPAQPDPTPRQAAVLEFIRSCIGEGHPPPTYREIAEHFGFRSANAAADHVRALRRKGLLATGPRQARGLRPTPVTEASKGTPSPLRRARILDIPLLGLIPAGFADGRESDAEGCISVDVDTLGFTPGPRTFALEVRGDSMIGKHILEGDIVIFEHGRTPRDGDVVAALIDNENTLKTFVTRRGRPCLKAENPRYPDLIPAAELVIQGVMTTLIRRTP